MEHIVELKGFNPFMYIFIFEEFLINSNLYEKDKLIQFMKIIEENKSNPNLIEGLIESIENTIEKQVNGGVTTESNTGNQTDLDINKQIEETISILKKMCTSKNMIELFMEVVYFNEKSNAKIKR